MLQMVCAFFVAVGIMTTMMLHAVLCLPYSDWDLMVCMAGCPLACCALSYYAEVCVVLCSAALLCMLCCAVLCCAVLPQIITVCCGPLTGMACCAALHYAALRCTMLYFATSVDV